MKKSHLWEPNYESDETLISSILQAHPNSVDLLQGQTPLMTIAFLTFISIRTKVRVSLQILEHSTIDVNIQDNDGWTALHYVCRFYEFDYYPIFLQLLRKGANSHLETICGNTAWDWLKPLHQPMLLPSLWWYSNEALSKNQLTHFHLNERRHFDNLDVGRRIDACISLIAKSTTLEKLTLGSYTVSSSLILAENTSIVEIVNKTTHELGSILQNMLIRNRLARTKCFVAAACTRKFFRSLLCRDVANMIAEYVESTKGTRVWIN